MKKIVLLSLLIVTLAVLSASVCLAAWEIDRAEITVTAPEVGSTPDYAPRNPMNGLFNVGVTGECPTEWYRSKDGVSFTKMSKTDKFAAGYYYRITTAVELTYGMDFAGNWVPAINGRPAKAENFAISSGIPCRKVTYTFPKLQDDKKISHVEITALQEPYPNMPQSYSFTLGSHCDYAMPGAGAAWYKSENGTDFTKYLTNGKEIEDYKVGYVIRFLTVVSPQAGYSFASDLTASVNGRPANVDEVKLIDGVEYATVSLTFPRLMSDITITETTDISAIYRSDMPVYASVKVANASGDYLVNWYETEPDLGFTGKYYGSGTEIDLPGITSDEMMTRKAVMVTVMDENGRMASKQIDYMLVPMGVEEGALSPAISVWVSPGESPWWVDAVGKNLTLTANCGNADGGTRIVWYECSKDGEIVPSKRLGTGATVTLPKMTAEDKGKTRYFLVKATDKRGDFFGGTAIIPYMLIEATPGPTEKPTAKPTEVPTEKPTEVPTAKPTEVPTEKPTEVPTAKPTEVPTENPTEIPTETQNVTPICDGYPTPVAPTEVPTESATEEGTTSAEPTEPAKTAAPTENPTDKASDSEPAAKSTPVLTYVLAGAVVILTAAVGVLVGILIGKKK